MSNIMTSADKTSTPKVSKLMSKASQDPPSGQDSTTPAPTNSKPPVRKGTTRSRSKSADASKTPSKKLKLKEDGNNDGKKLEIPSNSGNLNTDIPDGQAKSDNEGNTSNVDVPSLQKTVTEQAPTTLPNASEASPALPKEKSTTATKLGSTPGSEVATISNTAVESSTSAPTYFTKTIIKKLWGINDKDLSVDSILKFLQHNEVVDIDQIANFTIEISNFNSVSFFESLMLVKKILSFKTAELASISIPAIAATNRNYFKETLKWSTVLAATKSTPMDMINGAFYCLAPDVYNEIPMMVQNYIGNVHKDISYLINFQRSTSLNLANHLTSLLFNGENSELVLRIKFALYDWIFGMLYGSQQSATHSMLKVDTTKKREIQIEYRNDENKTALASYQISSYVLDHNKIQVSSPWDLKEFDFTTINSLVKFLNFCGIPSLDFEMSAELANALDKMKLVRLLRLEEDKEVWKFYTPEDKFVILLEHSTPHADLSKVIDSVCRLPYNSRLEVIFKLQEKGLKRLFACEKFEPDEYERYIFLGKWSCYKNNAPIPFLFSPDVKDEVKKTFASVANLLKLDKLRNDLLKITRQGLFSEKKQKEIAGLQQQRTTTTPTTATTTMPTTATTTTPTTTTID